MAQSLLAAGDASAAEPHARRATELATGDDPSIAANAQLDLARVHDALGREAEAAPCSRRPGAPSTDPVPGGRGLVRSGPRRLPHRERTRGGGEDHAARARASYESFLGPKTPFLPYADRVVAAARPRWVARSSAAAPRIEA